MEKSQHLSIFVNVLVLVSKGLQKRRGLDVFYANAKELERDIYKKNHSVISSVHCLTKDVISSFLIQRTNTLHYTAHQLPR